MKSTLAAAMAVMFVLAAGPVTAGEKSPESVAQEHRKWAQEYRDMSQELNGTLDEFEDGEWAQATRLADIYVQIAEIKEELADTIAAEDWEAMERVEERYHQLKQQEQALANAIWK